MKKSRGKGLLTSTDIEDIWHGELKILMRGNHAQAYIPKFKMTFDIQQDKMGEFHIDVWQKGRLVLIASRFQPKN